MIKKIKKAYNPPITESTGFWTIFALAFAYFLYHCSGWFKQNSSWFAAVFAAVNLLFAVGWLYFRSFSQKNRLEANRNSERIFGTWLLFALVLFVLLHNFSTETTLKLTLLLLSALLVSVLTVFFFAAQETKLLISNLEIISPKLKRDRIRLVHISDLHAGLWAGYPYLKELVTSINKLEPDIIVCSGDLKDERLGANCGEELTCLLQLEAPLGKYAVLGNHDYTNSDEAADFIEQAGFELLNSRAQEVGGIIIAGAGDRDHLVKQQWYLTKSELLVLAYEFVQKDNLFILLRHRPIVEDGQLSHFDLQLSGAKHGISILRVLLRKFGIAFGKGKFKKIKQGGLLYKADGAGYIGVPVRVFCKPEIAVIDLIKEKSEDAPAE